ncbi:hypothetical protein [Roseateles sp.]|uniref:hypothetical protein n=1 Tax=Roseateles sp. TaxID=1971397 RepID=UPI003BA8078F
MQQPTWARLASKLAPAAKPAPKQAATKAASVAVPKPAEPSPRDEAWWVKRMHEWRKDDPARPFPRGKLNLWLELTPDGAVRDALTDDLPTNLDLLLDRMICGESMSALAEYVTELFGFRVSAYHVRMAMTSTPDRLAKYNLARHHYAHQLVEEATKDADSARRHGDFRYSGDFRMKLAGKLAPEHYGDKAQLEVGGITGKPVEHKVEGQSPAEAYKALVGASVK